MPPAEPFPNPPDSTPNKLLLTIGACVFLGSFFLPAVTMLPDGSWGPHGPVPGWKCAIFAPVMFLSMFSDGGRHAVGLALTGISGLVNPLLLVYLVATGPWRSRLAWLTLIGLIASFPAQAANHMSPLPGCFVWVAGALLLLASRFTLGQSPLPAARDL